MSWIKGYLFLPSIICHEYQIRNYTINQDGSIDVDEPVRLLGRFKLTKIPLKFGKVSRSFDCSYNKLVSLKGSPVETGGSFSCDHNYLTTFIGGPKIVLGEHIWFQENKIKDFNGFPVAPHGNSLKSFRNPVDEILNLMGNQALVIKFIKWLNEYDVIRDGNKIVEMRLEEAYYMTMKKELPMNNRTFENYQLI